MESVRCERYYLFVDNYIELRIQRKGDLCELERKVVADHAWVRDSFKAQISEKEFTALLKSSIGNSIVFQKYSISVLPKIAIKKYEDRLHDFTLAEVEFETLEDAMKFTPLEWMGEDVSHEAYARDSGLIYLSAPPSL